MTKKQTIIMIHGFRGTHDGLMPIANKLKKYTTLVPDLPGFASGETLAHYDLDAYVAWLHRFIQQQKLSEPPVLLGHSFGSIVSAAYTAKYPQTIEKLILVNPIGAPALEGPRGIFSKLAVFYYFIGTKLPKKLAHRWLASRLIVDVMSQAMTKTKDPTIRKFIFAQHRQYFSLFHSPTSVSEAFETSVTHNVREFAADIPVPTLLIAGEKDDITPLEKQKELREVFPHAVLETIDGVGHLTHYETPDQIALFVDDFIKFV